jgi:hypothetical protein
MDDLCRDSCLFSDDVAADALAFACLCHVFSYLFFFKKTREEISLDEAKCQRLAAAYMATCKMVNVTRMLVRMHYAGCTFQ